MMAYTVQSPLTIQQAMSKITYQLWRRALISYFAIVSAESCIDSPAFLARITISNFANNFNRFSCKFNDKQWGAD